MQGLPTSTPSVTLDKNGLPWDDRIHAGTKTQNKDGSWKAKKGVDAALVTSVEAELRARVGNAQPAALPLPGALPTQPQPSLPQALPGAHTAALPGQFNPAQAMPGAPIASPSEPTTFEQLMMRCTGAMTAGILAPTALQNVCVQLGLGSAVTLQANPQFVPNVWAQLKATTPGLQ
jgi:hypothetical protein